MSTKKAIMVAANLKGNFRPDSNDVGNIISHATHIEKYGAVVWSIVRPGQRIATSFAHSDIKRGYFYNVTERAVTHIFDVDYLCAADEVPEKRTFMKYLPASRKLRWRENPDDFFWMKISGIYHLKSNHDKQDFRKFDNGKQVTLCRNYVIIKDPEYRHFDRKITRREVMSDLVSSLLVAGRCTEKDIEDLFFHHLSDRLEFVERQGSFKKEGRLDLLFKNHRNRYTVFEIKKGTATIDALGQVKRYIRACRKKYHLGPNKVKGVVLAQSIDPMLAKATAQEEDIETRTYFFSIGMK